MYLCRYVSMYVCMYECMYVSCYAPGIDQDGGEARRVPHDPFWATLARSPRLVFTITLNPRPYTLSPKR